MRNLILILMLAVLLIPGYARAQKPPKDATVWVAEDIYKIHPLSGNYYSEGLQVYKGNQPSELNYREKSDIWDAGSKTVSLYAGRNEFVSFQVVLEKGREDLHKVFITCTDLLGPGERISADSDIKLFKQLYLKLDDVWYPDALLPFDLAGTTPMDLPDYYNFPDQKVQAVWVDIYVPHDIPAGTYTGKINVVHRATNKQDVLDLNLVVGDFSLPDEMNLDVDLMNYGFLNIERGWPDMIIGSDRHAAIEQEFFRSAHEHRTTFAILPYNHDGMLPKGAKPELAGRGESVRIKDWSNWDKRFGPVLSGEAFKDLPRSGVPVNHFFLPYCLMWPSDMVNWSKPEYKAEYLEISRQFREHFAEKGWTAPQYQIYYNHKEHYNFFPWNLDEPTRDGDLQALKYLGEILDESFPEDDPVEVAYRLDIGHFHCENVETCEHKRKTGEVVIKELGDVVDLWNIGSPHYFANLKYVRELKDQGKTLYFYSGTPRVVEEMVKSVFWGWYGFKYEADGVCFWNATDWTDWDTDRMIKDPYTNAGGRYAGFSMVFYPGYKFGYDGPVVSMRMKGLRRGLQDFEYARLLEQKGLMSRKDIIAMADKYLLGDSIDYPALRKALFMKLAGE